MLGWGSGEKCDLPAAFLDCMSEVLHEPRLSRSGPRSEVRNLPAARTWLKESFELVGLVYNERVYLQVFPGNCGGLQWRGLTQVRLYEG